MECPNGCGKFVGLGTLLRCPKCGAEREYENGAEIRTFSVSGPRKGIVGTVKNLWLDPNYPNASDALDIYGEEAADLLKSLKPNQNGDVFPVFESTPHPNRNVFAQLMFEAHADIPFTLSIDGVEVGEITHMEHSTTFDPDGPIVEETAYVMEPRKMEFMPGVWPSRAEIDQIKKKSNIDLFQQEYPLEPYFPEICPTCEKPTPCSHYRDLVAEREAEESND